MSETKHTPGPWKWWTSNSWRRLSQDIPLAKDGGVLCPYVARDGHPDVIVSDADARLIAAAPDMAEALREADSALERLGLASFDAPRDVIRAALSKAGAVDE